MGAFQTPPLWKLKANPSLPDWWSLFQRREISPRRVGGKSKRGKKKKKDAKEKKAHTGARSIRSLRLLLPVVPPRLRVSAALHHFSLCGCQRGWGDSTLPLAAIHKSPHHHHHPAEQAGLGEGGKKGKTHTHTQPHSPAQMRGVTKTKGRWRESA